MTEVVKIQKKKVSLFSDEHPRKKPPANHELELRKEYESLMLSPVDKSKLFEPTGKNQLRQKDLNYWSSRILSRRLFGFAKAYAIGASLTSLLAFIPGMGFGWLVVFSLLFFIPFGLTFSMDDSSSSEARVSLVLDDTVQKYNLRIFARWVKERYEVELNLRGPNIEYLHYAIKNSIRYTEEGPLYSFWLDDVNGKVYYVSSSKNGQLYMSTETGKELPLAKTESYHSVEAQTPSFRRKNAPLTQEDKLVSEILGAVALLRQGELDATQTHAVERAEREAGEAVEVFNRLNELGEVDSTASTQEFHSLLSNLLHELELIVVTTRKKLHSQLAASNQVAHERIVESTLSLSNS